PSSPRCAGEKSPSDRSIPRNGNNRHPDRNGPFPPESHFSGDQAVLEVHVITGANRHLYERELDEHHQIRHRIYVGELQWRGLTARADKREYDQFDLPETVYLLALEEGRV